MKQIELTKGFFALVDDEDFERLSKKKWCVFLGPTGNKYARRRATGPKKDGWKGEQMHRVILGIADPKIRVDHRDMNGLNNQRSNLRLCTPSQNATNRLVDKRSTTGFKGVCKTGKNWRAVIVLNYKQKYLGAFNCPIEAAKAYDRAAIELHGDFARLNFP